jgi:type I restriction enzyme S subunit
MSLDNNIPKGWVETTLGEVCEKMYSGGTPSTKRNEYYGGEIPWIRTQEVKFNFIKETEIKITELGLKESSAKYIPKDTVIIAMYGNSAGRVALSKIKATTNQACCNFISNKIKSNSYFIYYNLLSRYREIEGKANGAAQQNLSVGVLKDLSINLPPLPEQKAIAAILTAFDDKIENLQAQNKTLESIAQTIFKEWFGKYQIGDLSADKAGELPEGWRVGKITELFEIRDGTHDSPKQQETGFKLITSKHLGDNRIKLEEAYLISEEDYINVNKRSRVESFDILVSMIGTIGITYLEQNDSISYAIKNVALFKTSQNKPFSIYTYLWLKSSFGKYFYETSKSGTTQEYISLKSFRAIWLVIPNRNTINKFNDIVFNLFGKIKNNTAQIQTLKQTRDTLLPKLMSGQLRAEEFKK